MSMQKLRGIRNTGVYTAQRSMVEHLLVLEEIILREIPNIKDIPTTRKILAQQLEQYKIQHRLSTPFQIQDIQYYLFATAEKKLNREKSQVRGLYTSALIQQIEGDSPITIDMEREEIHHLLYAINTPRHITISNTKGNHTGVFAGCDQGNGHLTLNNTKGLWTGACAGSHHGQANLTINNTKGDNTGADAGSYQGQAHLTINNTKGDNTGADAGSYQGQAHLTINNTKGDNTGAYAGSNHGTAHLTIHNTKGDFTGLYAGYKYGTAHLVITNVNGKYTGANAGRENGKAIIIGCHTQGQNQFFNHRGIVVSYRSEETPKIERVKDSKIITQIQSFIAQNSPPEDIMNYLRRHT